MECWIGLTERKVSKKEKNMFGEKKIVLHEHLIARKFFAQHFQAHPTKFSCWIGLLFVSSNNSFL